MRAAVDHVQHRNGQRHRRVAAEPEIQRLARFGGGCLRGCERGAEDRVRTEAPLVGRPVEVDQRAVEAFLIGCVAPAQRLGDLAVDVADRLQDGLAAPRRPAVAELDRLVDAGRGAGRDDRAAERAGVEPDVDLDRRIAPRVDDLPSAHLSDLHVAPSPLAWS